MTHKLNEAAMLTPAELIEALEAEMYFPDPSSDAVINAATAISLARKLAPVEVDDETIEATCQLLCRHFENLKRAESDGGGELWYGELERIVRKEIRPTTAGWQDISTAPKDGTIIDLWADGEFPSRYTNCYWGSENEKAWEVYGAEYCGPRWWSQHGFPVETGDCKVTHWMSEPLPPAPSPEQKG